LMSTMSYYQQLAPLENNLPDGYIVTDAYLSPESIHLALKLQSICSQISLDMSSNVWKTIVYMFVKDKPTMDKWNNDLELLFFYSDSGILVYFASAHQMSSRILRNMLWWHTWTCFHQTQTYIHWTTCC
jgi:hypothetical protein